MLDFPDKCSEHFTLAPVSTRLNRANLYFMALRLKLAADRSCLGER
jgi:hypothetical protein